MREKIKNLSIYRVILAAFLFLFLFFSFVNVVHGEETLDYEQLEYGTTWGPYDLFVIRLDSDYFNTEMQGDYISRMQYRLSSSFATTEVSIRSVASGEWLISSTTAITPDGIWYNAIFPEGEITDSTCPSGCDIYINADNRYISQGVDYTDNVSFTYPESVTNDFRGRIYSSTTPEGNGNGDEDLGDFVHGTTTAVSAIYVFNALGVTMIAVSTYFLIFFMVFGVIFWGIAQVIKPIFKIIDYG